VEGIPVNFVDPTGHYPAPSAGYLAVPAQSHLFSMLGRTLSPEVLSSVFACSTFFNDPRGHNADAPWDDIPLIDGDKTFDAATVDFYVTNYFDTKGNIIREVKERYNWNIIGYTVNDN